MARVNVYLPDSLAEAVKKVGINVSSVAQKALREALAARETDRWLDDIDGLGRTSVTHDDVVEAVRRARNDLGDVGHG